LWCPNRLYLRLCCCWQHTTANQLVCELKPHLCVCAMRCWLPINRNGSITSVVTVPIGWSYGALYKSSTMSNVLSCTPGSLIVLPSDQSQNRKLMTSGPNDHSWARDIDHSNGMQGVSLYTMDISQAPSPESNPNSPSPVNATVVHYTTVESW